MGCLSVCLPRRQAPPANRAAMAASPQPRPGSELTPGLAAPGSPSRAQQIPFSGRLPSVTCWVRHLLEKWQRLAGDVGARVCDCKSLLFTLRKGLVPTLLSRSRSCTVLHVISSWKSHKDKLITKIPMPSKSNSYGRKEKTECDSLFLARATSRLPKHNYCLVCLFKS